MSFRIRVRVSGPIGAAPHTELCAPTSTTGWSSRPMQSPPHVGAASALAHARAPPAPAPPPAPPAPGSAAGGTALQTQVPTSAPPPIAATRHTAQVVGRALPCMLSVHCCVRACVFARLAVWGARRAGASLLRARLGENLLPTQIVWPGSTQHCTLGLQILRLDKLFLRC